MTSPTLPIPMIVAKEFLLQWAFPVLKRSGYEGVRRAIALMGQPSW
ncbi:hypothetical protein AB0758_49400 [Tolypothrix bouteillei VB521301_2]